MTIRWKAVEQYFTVELFVFQFYPVIVILENVSILDLASLLSTSERVKRNSIQFKDW